MKVGIASTDWGLDPGDGSSPVMGGSLWVRYGQYVGRTAADMILGTLAWREGRFGVRTWDGAVHMDLDVLVMQRCMFADASERMPAALKGGQVIVNDIDDWYFGLPTSNPAWVGSHPRISATDNVNHYRRILGRSSLVTTSTPELANRMRRIVSCEVQVVPNTVDVARMAARPSVDGDGDPVLGYVGSLAWHAGDVESVRGVLPRSGWRWFHGGHVDRPGVSSFATAAGLPEKSVNTLPMTDTAEYPSLFRLEAGIVPLARGTFNDCKSGLKGLEYAAAGIPFAAADTPSYRRLADLGIGMTCPSPNRWRSSLQSLHDPKERKDRADAALTAVAAQFDVSHGASWLDAVWTTVASR